MRVIKRPPLSSLNKLTEIYDAVKVAILSVYIYLKRGIAQNPLMLFYSWIRRRYSNSVSHMVEVQAKG